MKLEETTNKPDEPPADFLSHIRELVGHLRDGLGDDLLGVALFGSRARSEGREGKDLDLFIVARNLPEHPFDRAEKVLSLGGGGFQTLIVSQNEFETRFPSIFLDIGLDGIVLHENNGYLTDRLARIRAIIDEAGLIRGHDLIWRWERPPQGNWTIDWTGFHGQLMGEDTMNNQEEYARRMKYAIQYLKEAEEAFSLKLWRISCASSQQATENAGKAVYALYRAVPKVHDMSAPIRELIKAALIPEDRRDHIERLAALCDLLGVKEHILIAYGDEAGDKTPWELADESRARRSLQWAREAVALAEKWMPPSHNLRTYQP